METTTRSRNSSEEDGKGREFPVILKRPSADEKSRIRLRTRQLQGHQGIQIYLTIDDDPAFFYSVDITEDDYRNLRQNQGLFVDLAAFPAMIFRLLDTCITEDCKCQQSGEMAKFAAILEFSGSRGEEVSFEIQETNSFRRLAHLSLKFRRGSDAKVREHLAECLKSLRIEHKVVVNKLTDVQDILKVVNEEKTGLERNLEAVRLEAHEKDVLFQGKLASELSTERKKVEEVVSNMRINFESERRKITEDTALTIRGLENRVAALDYDNRDLTEKRHKSEAIVLRLKDEQKAASAEIARLKAELDRNRAEKDKIGNGNIELDRNLNKLKAHVELLETEKSRIAADLHSRDEIIDDLRGQNRRLDEELQEKRHLVTKREAGVKSVSQELMKANDVIKTLQEQNRKQDQKIKLGCKIVAEQEKVVGDKYKELETVREDVKSKNDELVTERHERVELQQRLDEARRRIDELEKRAKTNEAVVQWLNKQLTVAQSRDPGLRLGPLPDGLENGRSLNFSNNLEKVKATSTPLSAGIDPKYLEPSPKLTTPRMNGSRGLLRKNISKGGSPQSVYFAKT